MKNGKNNGNQNPVNSKEDEFARFVSAQDGVYEQAVRELADGKKKSHWIWFIFPQLRGLGRSQMSRTYAITSLKAAQRYLEHPLLGKRLRHCTELVLAAETEPIEAIFGHVDAMKFHSCMTLFSIAAGEDSIFSKALECCFNGEQDAATLRLLKERGEL